MKTKIGLPFGLALVMFIGVFTAMLALGVLTPERAEAAATDSVVLKLSDTAINSNPDITIMFTNGVAEIVDTDMIVITFTSGFETLGDTARIATNWKIDVGPTGAGDAMVNPEPVNPDGAVGGSGTTAELELPEGTTVPVGAEVEITFTAPDDAGGYPTGGIMLVSAGDTALTVNINNFVSTPEMMTAGNRVANLRVTNDPTDPGAQARYQIKFATSPQLNEGTDDIILNIDASVGVPTSLGQQDVRVSASLVTGMADDGGSTPNQSRPLDDAPRYRVIPGTDNRKEYRITIPDMDGSPDRNSSIAENAVVTVTLQANAGFTNATESGNDDFKVSTTRQNRRGRV